MSRAEAYMKAYGQKNRDTARKTAHELITTNPDVRAEIDRLLSAGLEAAREMLQSESVATTEKLITLRRFGNREYGVQMAACKDILDRIGLKPKEQVEHSGEMVFRLIDVDMSGYPKQFNPHENKDA